MNPVPAGDVTHEYVGRTDQAGFVITRVHDTVPASHIVVSLDVRHETTGVEQVWDLTADDVLWLRDAVELIGHVVYEPPERWVEIARTVATEVTSA